MLISTGWWKRFYDEGDGGSAGDATSGGSGDSTAASAGSTEGGDPGVGGDAGGGGGGSDSDAGGSSGAGDGSDTGVAGAGGGQAGAAGATHHVAPDFSGGLLGYVRDKFGVDLGRKYQNGEQAIQGLLNAARLVGQRSQEAEVGRRFAGYETEFEQFLRERQQAAQQQAQRPQTQEPWWNPPSFDDSWNKWVTRDQDGNAILKEDTPLEVRRAIEERRTYLERWQHQLATDPVKALQAPLEQFKQQVRDELLSEIHQQQQYQQQTQYAGQFVNENAGWIYQTGQDGRIIRDFQTGQPVPTPAGAYFIQSLMQLGQSGMQDQQQMVQIAMQMTRGAVAMMQGTQGNTQGTAAPGAGSAPSPAAGTATGAASQGAPPTNTQRRRQPTGGVLPGETRVPAGRGKSVRELLMAGASSVPDAEFAEAE